MGKRKSTHKRPRELQREALISAAQERESRSGMNLRDTANSRARHAEEAAQGRAARQLDFASGEEEEEEEEEAADGEEEANEEREEGEEEKEQEEKQSSSPIHRTRAAAKRRASQSPAAQTPKKKTPDRRKKSTQSAKRTSGGRQQQNSDAGSEEKYPPPPPKSPPSPSPTQPQRSSSQPLRPSSTQQHPQRTQPLHAQSDIAALSSSGLRRAGQEQDGAFERASLESMRNTPLSFQTPNTGLNGFNYNITPWRTNVVDDGTRGSKQPEFMVWELHEDLFKGYNISDEVWKFYQAGMLDEWFHSDVRKNREEFMGAYIAKLRRWETWRLSDTNHGPAQRFNHDEFTPALDRRRLGQRNGTLLDMPSYYAYHDQMRAQWNAGWRTQGELLRWILELLPNRPKYDFLKYFLAHDMWHADNLNVLDIFDAWNRLDSMDFAATLTSQEWEECGKTRAAREFDRKEGRFPEPQGGERGQVSMYIPPHERIPPVDPPKKRRQAEQNNGVYTVAPTPSPNPTVGQLSAGPVEVINGLRRNQCTPEVWNALVTMQRQLDTIKTVARETGVRTQQVSASSGTSAIAAPTRSPPVPTSVRTSVAPTPSPSPSADSGEHLLRSMDHDPSVKRWDEYMNKLPRTNTMRRIYFQDKEAFFKKVALSCRRYRKKRQKQPEHILKRMLWHADDPADDWLWNSEDADTGEALPKEEVSGEVMKKRWQPNYNKLDAFGRPRRNWVIEDPNKKNEYHIVKDRMFGGLWHTPFGIPQPYARRSRETEHVNDNEDMMERLVQQEHDQTSEGEIDLQAPSEASVGDRSNPSGADWDPNNPDDLGHEPEPGAEWEEEEEEEEEWNDEDGDTEEEEIFPTPQHVANGEAVGEIITRQRRPAVPTSEPLPALRHPVAPPPIPASVRSTASNTRPRVTFGAPPTNRATGASSHPPPPPPPPPPRGNQGGTASSGERQPTNRPVTSVTRQSTPAARSSRGSGGPGGPPGAGPPDGDGNGDNGDSDGDEGRHQHHGRSRSSRRGSSRHRSGTSSESDSGSGSRHNRKANPKDFPKFDKATTTPEQHLTQIKQNLRLMNIHPEVWSAVLATTIHVSDPFYSELSHEANERKPHETWEEQWERVSKLFLKNYQPTNNVREIAKRDIRLLLKHPDELIETYITRFDHCWARAYTKEELRDSHMEAEKRNTFLHGLEDDIFREYNRMAAVANFEFLTWRQWVQKIVVLYSNRNPSEAQTSQVVYNTRAKIQGDLARLGSKAPTTTFGLGDTSTFFKHTGVNGDSHQPLWMKDPLQPHKEDRKRGRSNERDDGAQGPNHPTKKKNRFGRGRGGSRARGSRSPTHETGYVHAVSTNQQQTASPSSPRQGGMQGNVNTAATSPNNIPIAGQQYNQVQGPCFACGLGHQWKNCARNPRAQNYDPKVAHYNKTPHPYTLVPGYQLGDERNPAKKKWLADESRKIKMENRN